MRDRHGDIFSLTCDFLAIYHLLCFIVFCFVCLVIWFFFLGFGGVGGNWLLMLLSLVVDVVITNFFVSS